uniref:aECM cysteine-cradle domain-containing protein n=1 Tax=Parastrongyloides trichosuri TaxID=131310 RepID=A0A0N4ZK34_PARTI
MIPISKRLNIHPIERLTNSRRITSMGSPFIIRVPENMHYRPRSSRYLIKQTIKSTIPSEPETTTTPNIVIPLSAKVKTIKNEATLSLKEIAIKTCKKIDIYKSIYNVSDIKTFARDNCFLIQIYYPEISCKDIKEMVDYCVEKNFFRNISN